jgi:thiamine pyrophosphate-dependent acetolactate synthase large subunit-like protein
MMTLLEALELVARHRGDQVVISTMASVAVWPTLSDGPLDFAYIPSAMGHAPGLAQGLSLATGRGVIVLNGDGSTLMNLGCLVTLAQTPANVKLLILDNGLYEVTGGQPTAQAHRVDFAAMAHAAGLPGFFFGDLSAWQTECEERLQSPGPCVLHLHIEGRRGQSTPRPPRSMAEQLKRLRSKTKQDDRT